MRMSGDISTNWDIFRAEFEDYELATGLIEKPEEVRAAALRRLMGNECRHIYSHNIVLTEAQAKNPKAILDALGAYFKPAKNVIYERYMFGCCKQEVDEPIDSFLTRLRERASTCDYKELKDEMIRDRLVLGIANENTRRRLLRERELTLSQSVEICRLAEAMEQRVKTIDSSISDSINIAQAQRLKRKDGENNKERTLRTVFWTVLWGRSHKRQRTAPRMGRRRSCGVLNHFAKVCRARQRAYSSGRVNVVMDDARDEQAPYSESRLFTAKECIDTVRCPGPRWFVNLTINKQKQACQLDTGATCNVISRIIKEKLDYECPLQPSATKLKLYSGATMPSLGRFHTECTVKGTKHKLIFEVVEANQEPLLSGDTCQRLGLMKFTIPEELHKLVECPDTALTKQQLICSYKDVFNDPVESVPGEVRFVLDSNVSPVQCAPRNVPVALKARVKEQLDKHIREGHITSVTEPTSWISNMVVVAKPDKMRICIDPKHLNQALQRSHYHMPTLEDILYKLPKARLFTLVDVRDAFLHCRLDDESSLMTTFWTPWGRMRWCKLPFGVSVAPEIYQRKQHELLMGLRGIEPIADDILVVGCSDSDAEAESDHDKNLRALMERCRAVKLRLSEKKLQFKLKAVHFHGHILSAEGLRIDPEKTKAVLAMPTPQDVKAVQRLIGFVTYLAKFLPRLSDVCEPLRRLLDKGVAWHWLPKHDEAVQEIKRMITDTPVLKYYDIDKPVTIQSDASKNGLGCCLLQQGQPVAFASRALTHTEQNYAQIEKECLSIVFACHRFHHYLYGRESITAETDHKPLVTICKKSLLSAPKRLQSMMLQLQNYNLNVVYKPGPEMYISDTLSRAALHKQAPNEPALLLQTVNTMDSSEAAFSVVDQALHLNVTDASLRKIVNETKSDGTLQELANIVLAGWPERKEDVWLSVRKYWPFRDELNIQNGVLFRGQCVIIPKALRAEMLTRIHATHIGGEACYRQAKETLFWPNMRSEIKDYVTNCAACNEYAHKQQKETMMSHEIPVCPWQIVSMDLYAYGGKEFLIIVVHYSDYWEIDQLPDLTADTVITRCKVQFARYGQPDQVITDNGPQFAREPFRSFARQWGFVHVTSSPQHPQSNGKAAVKIVKSLCKRAKLDGSDPWLARPQRD
ncbi:Retrovirus-related Pol poly from transposon [Labeo rohita]|uniref:Gypsy retrotransposon integrase-like protein 1 n=1 Tax=Labeo rohita TaxID=84645 RepID=A0A498NJ87_LABRO|nr:Retrovirus-related Pol poly from transposon [Labeo rohita]